MRLDGVGQIELNDTTVYSGSAASVGQLNLKNFDTTTAYTPAVLDFTARGTTTTASVWQMGNAGLNSAYAESDFFIKNRTAASTYAQRFLIEGNGDVSFYEDTGTTPKMVWSASDEKLTLSGAGGLYVGAGSAGDPSIKMNDANSGLFAPAGNVVAISAGGGERFRATIAGIDVTGTVTSSAGITATTGTFSGAVTSASGMAITKTGVSANAYDTKTGTNGSSVAVAWYDGVNPFGTDGSYEIKNINGLGLLLAQMVVDLATHKDLMLLLLVRPLQGQAIGVNWRLYGFTRRRQVLMVGIYALIRRVQDQQPQPRK